MEHSYHQDGCVDFQTQQRASAAVPRNSYGLKFISKHCLNNHSQHQSEEGKKSRPEKEEQCLYTPKKRNECAKTYMAWEVANKHICGYSECPSCKRYLNLCKHQCHIQNPKELAGRAPTSSQGIHPPSLRFGTVKSKGIHVYPT